MAVWWCQCLVFLLVTETPQQEMVVAIVWWMPILWMLFIHPNLYQHFPFDYNNFVLATRIHFLWHKCIFLCHARLWMKFLLCFVMPHSKFCVWRDWFLPQECQSTLKRNYPFDKKFCSVSWIFFPIIKNLDLVNTNVFLW